MIECAKHGCSKHFATKGCDSWKFCPVPVPTLLCSRIKVNERFWPTYSKFPELCLLNLLYPL